MVRYAKRIYLAGPINACTDSEAQDWREYVKSKLPSHEFLDPMMRDYRGRELEPGIAGQIVRGDKADIECTDLLLVFAPKPSVGTSMEIFYAYHVLGKPVIVIHPGDKPSPWIICHSDKIFKTLDEAISLLRFGDLVGR